MGINLQGVAQTIATECGDKGAIEISYRKQGVRIGINNLAHADLREALWTAIRYPYVFEEKDG